MATLTNDDCTPIRRLLTETFPAHGATKPQINAAAQVIEDWFEANRSALSAAINVATAPLVLTNQQKKAILRGYMLVKFRLEG